jgi:hypothetical protein
MQTAREAGRVSGPKQKDRRRYSYDEGADEPARLIENEATDVERECPADDNEPVERIKDQDGGAPPAFEE